MQLVQKKQDKVIGLGWNVPASLKLEFQLEAKRRRLKDQEALAEAMRLWLGNSGNQVVRLSPREIRILERLLLNPTKEGDKKIGDLISHVLKHIVED